jgi:hypothetical protein
MKTIALLFGIALLMLFAAPAWAQTTTTISTTNTGPTASAAVDAVTIAQGGVDASLRDRVVSVYGVGRPAAIETWWVMFYDPSVPSHGRAVKVENGQIASSYEATGGVVYDDTLTFPASAVTGDGPALAAAQNYAAEHALPYDSVRALLRVTSANQALRWRVQLLHDSASKGFVFVNVSDGEVALYSPPGTVHTHATTSTGGGVEGDAERAANDVKNTFLGIGGDLQEFFTGERTVDQ